MLYQKRHPLSDQPHDLRDSGLCQIKRTKTPGHANISAVLLLFSHALKWMVLRDFLDEGMVNRARIRRISLRIGSNVYDLAPHTRFTSRNRYPENRA